MAHLSLVASRPRLSAEAAEAASTQCLIALAFDSQLLARQALAAALRLQESGQLVVHDAVFVTGDGERPVQVIETTDPTPVAAAVPSSLFGALIGTLVAGPLGFLIGGVLAGSTGALVAKLVETGIADRTIHALRDLARPGQTVLALLVSEWSGGAVMQELQRFVGAHVVYAELPPASIAIVRQMLHDN